MNLKRCRDQEGTSLEDFYRSLESKHGDKMLEFLKAFISLPFEREIYGLTSASGLKLLSEDTYKSTHWVAVQPVHDGIRVSGLLGKPLVGRCDEFIEVLQDPKEAAQMALSAVQWSEGWR